MLMDRMCDNNKKPPLNSFGQACMAEQNALVQYCGKTCAKCDILLEKPELTLSLVSKFTAN